jgi:predicted transposase/invertase (TIGR01784 family)
MELGIDPKVDYAFKHLFGRASNRSILINVLDSILQPDPAGRIQDLEILNPFNDKEALDDKLSILDIKARDQAGRHFNIEMQMLAYPAYEKRIVYYACKLYQQQLREGHEYSELRPTISISFLNHVLFPEAPGHHLQFGLVERGQLTLLSDDLSFHILELPKFTKSADELQNGLDIWLYFLKYAEKMNSEALPTALNQPLVIRALEDLKMLSQTDLERERYESRLKAQMDHNSFIGAAMRQGRREERIATIHSLERMMDKPETPKEQLAGRSLDELQHLVEDCMKKLKDLGTQNNSNT